jgi:hypothetical protein
LRYRVIVADAEDHLLRRWKDDALGWTTERELLAGMVPWFTRDHGDSKSRVPDGVLRLRDAEGNEHRMAIEVELHDKRPKYYAAKLGWYEEQLQAGVFQQVWWLVDSEATMRPLLRARLAAKAGSLLHTLMEVAPLRSRAVTPGLRFGRGMTPSLRSLD